MPPINLPPSSALQTAQSISWSSGIGFGSMCAMIPMTWKISLIFSSLWPVQQMKWGPTTSPKVSLMTSSRKVANRIKDGNQVCLLTLFFLFVLFCVIWSAEMWWVSALESYRTLIISLSFVRLTICMSMVFHATLVHECQPMFVSFPGTLVKCSTSMALWQEVQLLCNSFLSWTNYIWS